MQTLKYTYETHAHNAMCDMKGTWSQVGEMTHRCREERRGMKDKSKSVIILTNLDVAHVKDSG